MAWALQLALAISTGTWALISWTTQLQVKGTKPAGGALANLAKLSVAALVQRWLIMVSLKLWAMAIGAMPMAVNPMAPKVKAPKVIVPGKPAESPLIKRIAAGQMPPPMMPGPRPPRR